MWSGDLTLSYKFDFGLNHFSRSELEDEPVERERERARGTERGKSESDFIFSPFVTQGTNDREHFDGKIGSEQDESITLLYILWIQNVCSDDAEHRIRAFVFFCTFFCILLALSSVMYCFNLPKTKRDLNKSNVNNLDFISIFDNPSQNVSIRLA